MAPRTVPHRNRLAFGLAVLFFLSLPALLPVRADTVAPSVVSAGFDESNRFVVVADFPAGFGHAALELAEGSPLSGWRTMIAAPVDGRSGTATFRLPRPAGAASAVVRVRVGPAPAPAAELTDPALVTISHAPDGGTIDEQIKIDNVSIMMEKHHEWRGLTREERNANLIAHARTLPNVVDAGYSAAAGTVYFIYSDGDASVIIDNRRVGTAPAAPVIIPPLTPAAEASLLRADVPVPPAEAGDIRGADADVVHRLPQSLDAVCAYSLEPAVFSNSAPAVAAALSSSGYSVRTLSTTTVADILSWRNLGVLFWQTHAGSIGGPPPDHPEQMCLCIGETPTREKSQGPYKEMRTGPNYELLIAGLPDRANPDNEKGVPVYALTSRFIANRMRSAFAPHALFALDACTGGHPDVAQPLLATGLGGLVSWNRESGVDSGTRFRQMFDRLLGRNVEPPVSTPKERPFDLKTVQFWMQDKGHDVDPSPPYVDGTLPNAQLLWYYHATQPAYALVPCIHRVLYEAEDQQHGFTKFLIEGSFGQDPGPTNRLVSWGDSVVEILDWRDPEGIRIKPPPRPYPAGDIQVFIGNRRSNAVPLTEWTIPVVYDLRGEGSLRLTIDLTVRLRSDVRKFREMPESAPATAPMAVWSLADCTGTVSASGLFKPDPDTTITWSGGSTLRSHDPTSAGASDSIIAGGTVNLVQSKFENFVLTVAGTFTSTTNGRASQQAATLDGFWWPPLPFTYDPVSYAVPGRSLQPQLPLVTEHAVSATLRWDTAIPKAAPTLDTPR